MGSIYIPTNVSPNGSIDVDLASNKFSCTVKGDKVVAYRILIYNNSDNSAVTLDSPFNAKITLANPLYNGDTLEFSLTNNNNNLVNQNNYNYKLELYSNNSYSSGTAQADPITLTNTIKLASTDKTPNSTYANGSFWVLYNGQQLKITNYKPDTQVATVDGKWGAISGRAYTILQMVQSPPVLFRARSTPLTSLKIPIKTGTAQATSSSTITLASSETAVNDFYNDYYITCENQTRKVTDYVASTKVATITPNWTSTPSSTATYEISQIIYSNATNPYPTPPLITQNNLTVTGGYTQAENSSLSYFDISFYDSGNEVIKTTGNTYSLNMTSKVDGLISSTPYTVYKVGMTVVTEDNVTVTISPITFHVNYNVPDIGATVTATPNYTNDSIIVDWSSVSDITGVVDGDYAFINNFIFTGGAGVRLFSDTIKTWADLKAYGLTWGQWKALNQTWKSMKYYVEYR